MSNDHYLTPHRCVDTFDMEYLSRLLHDELFAGSKDWQQGDVVERVQYLLSRVVSLREYTEFLEHKLTQKDATQ